MPMAVVKPAESLFSPLPELGYFYFLVHTAGILPGSIPSATQQKPKAAAHENDIPAAGFMQYTTAKIASSFELINKYARESHIVVALLFI
jgi:hypothetical protein